MAETLTGQAVVWGCNNFRVSGTGIVLGLGDGKPQSWDGERSSDVVDFTNADGETIGRAFVAFKKVINISVLPVDDQSTLNISAAETAMNAFLIAPGTKVTIADADTVATPDTGTIWENSHSGAWYLQRASVRRTNTAAAIIDMTLVQYEDNDITTSVSA